MPIPLKLSDVVEQLSMTSNAITVYLNKRTGEFVVLPEDEMFDFEDEALWDEEELGEQPEWLREQTSLRREVRDSDDFLALPDSFDIHDYQIMEDFCRAFPNRNTSNQLLDLIKGSGAFSRFRSAIRQLGVENAWNKFREQALEQIAVEWLERNEVPYVKPVAHANTRQATPNQRKERQTFEPVSKPKSDTSRLGVNQKRFNDQEIKVFISHQNSTCSECGEELGKKAWITLERDKGALCLPCADLDELVFLPAGDAALTRRAKKNSTLSAVVLKFSKARGRYERQGLLVQESALEQAEAECLADLEVRERRNERARERREELDEQYVRDFGNRIRALFPNCPKGREQSIAEHACLKYSGRVGRSAAAKSPDDEMVRLAVVAHIRHRETNYDELLAEGWFRSEARAEVRDKVEELLERWQVRSQAKSP